jgi:hypothetical protein
MRALLSLLATLPCATHPTLAGLAAAAAPRVGYPGQECYAPVGPPSTVDIG